MRSSILRHRSLWSWFIALFVLSAPSVAFAQEGGGVGVLGAFLAGLGTSLTPCVYPMIAITVSVFGAKQAKSRSEAMLLSTVFVAGMMTLFTSMFVIVALTGGVFGSILANRWVILGISGVFVIMAASMFGAFEMTLPESWMQRLSGVGGVGYGGAFTLGLVSGLVAAPCSGPILIGMMAVVTKSQSVALGVQLGLSYALGLGLLFWVVGTFAAGLPKGGRWMVWVKSFFGCVMLGLALYFAKNAFPELATFAKHETTFIALMAGLMVLGLAIGAVHVNWDDGGAPTKVRKAAGIAATVLGGFMLVSSIEKPAEVSAEELQAKQEQHRAEAEEKGEKVYPPLEFGKDLEHALATAKAEGRPMIIDFGAAWCGACKELEKHTFANADVKVKASRFVAVKFDATNEDDPKVKETMTKYKVTGLPAVLVYDASGNEVKRLTEFIPADAFLKFIEGV
jgi:thioredoxin:protein disulfide reductase